MIERPSMTALLVLALATALMLGACQASDEVSAELPTLAEPSAEASGETEDARSDDTEVSEADADLAMAQFESCMSDAGIELGSPGADGVFVESFESDTDATREFTGQAEIEAALEQCNTILEDTFGSFELSPEEQAEMDDANLELSRCLAEAGYDVDLSGGVFELDQTTKFEEFEAAMTACSPDIEFGTLGADE